MKKRKTNITTENGSWNFREKLNKNSATAALRTSDPKHIFARNTTAITVLHQTRPLSLFKGMLAT